MPRGAPTAHEISRETGLLGDGISGQASVREQDFKGLGFFGHLTDKMSNVAKIHLFFRCLRDTKKKSCVAYMSSDGRAERGLTLGRDSVVETLERAIREGDAQSYLLSPHPPRWQSIDFSPDRIGTLKPLCGEKQVNYSEFETIQKIKKSAAAIRKEEKELAKREKALAENQQLVQRLGLDKNMETQTVRTSAEAAVNSMRAKLAEMKAKHNKFVHSNDLRLELFAE
jgi:hypothetical protein